MIFTKYLCFLATIVAFASKSSAMGLVSRALPANWSPKGCYLDNTSMRILAGASTTDNAMTIEKCVNFCVSGGFPYAGVEFSRECYCDYALQNINAATDSTQCNATCAGDKNEVCGASKRINIYHDDSVAEPSVSQSASGTWTYVGCYPDSTSNRTLEHRFDIPTGVTADSCTTACAANQYSYAGLEFGKECWCGNSTGNALAGPEANCRTTCSAKHREFCGGNNALNVYRNNGSSPSPPQSCVATELKPFTMLAAYRANQTAAVIGVALDLEGLPLHIRGILKQGPGDWGQYTIKDGVMVGEKFIHQSGPIFTNASSTALDNGESPMFTYNLSGLSSIRFTGYCVATDSEGRSTLAANINGRGGIWSICRSAVVWNAQAGAGSDCVPIDIRLEYVN
ncbi:hypothetical protein HGRIS_004378 [Hohenbuehelia grisea]|uniref:WSC domain-containing protein n=1 Tax=Hohenbuehelia grisea TaxID=104357 RepID=A0ABR3JC16_9AGAR